ncbi:MAG: Glycogen synthase [Gammaproteobacteria bacterium]|nr:Glycogen synthase [Gammaproteobacteria bacterium]
MKKVLFAASEAHPLAKTGGLGEVCGALPLALQQCGHDVRVALPGYRTVLEQCGNVRVLAQLTVPGSLEPVRILETTLGRSTVPALIVDAPGMFDRAGGLYVDVDGRDYTDNANRFTVYCRAVVELAMDRGALYWQPDVVHCHDWQTGLVPALLARAPVRPGTVFTIHNIAYAGSFDRERFDSLHLPADLYTPESMEFYGRFAFIKGGLVYSDLITTVSPTYAREIRTPEKGCGLEGLLQHRSQDLVGIINGVNYALWDPAVDPVIAERYDAGTLENKRWNRRALQQDLGLREDEDALLIGVVSRLAYQKGMDLLPAALAPLWTQGVQLALLGSGDPRLQSEIEQTCREHPGRCAAYFGYNDTLAHRILAGADVFLMPSRYEPCGLGQLYAQRYGTVPVVRRTGGLADTVVPVNASTLAAGTATGVMYEDDSVEALSAAVLAAMYLRRAPAQWRQLQIAGMRRDFSWGESARAYAEVYRQARERRR